MNVDAVYSLRQADSPLLVSIPHSGTALDPSMRGRITEEALRLADTDWHVDRLYSFLDERSISVLKANYSRYVIDLNRPADGAPLYPGQDETGLCPVSSFSGKPLYLPGQDPDKDEISDRIGRYWEPYHDALLNQLQAIKKKYGYVILWDAHSIRSEVPRFFEGTLPDLNFGTSSGATCDQALSDALVAMGRASDYSTVINQRFRGGYITRQYGKPSEQINAIQLELAQCNYMDELSFSYREVLAANLQVVLASLVDTVVSYKPAYLS
ncbi:MAG: N-formylglutamate deformylase [Pseudomonadota bacterium]